MLFLKCIKKALQALFRCLGMKPHGLFLIIFCLTAIVNSERVKADLECNSNSLKRIEDYLNSIDTMHTRFSQLNQDGKLQEGEIYLSKPNHLKWEYLKPNHVMILVNKEVIIYHDYELDETTSLPSKSAIINLLSKKNINLKKDVILKRCIENEQYYELLITKANPDSDFDFDIWLRFNNNPISIERIATLSDNTVVSEVMFQDINYNIKISPNVFVFKDPKFFNKEIED